MRDLWSSVSRFFFATARMTRRFLRPPCPPSLCHSGVQQIHIVFGRNQVVVIHLGYPT